MTPIYPRWRAPTRTALALGGAILLTLLGAGMAEAHVTAQPGWATQGGYAVVALRVPTESESAGTVKVELTLPAQHPIADVLTTPMAGWTSHIGKVAVNPPLRTDDGTVSEVAHTITWTAQPGKRIEPDQYADFDVSLGPLPTDASQLVLPVVQTYDDGTVVNWDQPRAAGAPEPEHPAPTLTLLAAGAAGAGGGAGGHGAGGSPATLAVATADTDAASGSDSLARWIGGAGLLFGVIALVIAAGVAGRAGRTRRRPNARHGRPVEIPESRLSTSSGGRRRT
ncbi:MAG TPA: YcnI family protein [Pseudonocardia sp.]|nr:YcnI family protein [Pseudonocardia sp.]